MGYKQKIDHELGELIRVTRVQLGTSQIALSRQTGISRTEISRIKVGKRKQPSVTNLKLISNALHINYIQILVAAGYFTKKEVIEFYNKIS